MPGHEIKGTQHWTKIQLQQLSKQQRLLISEWNVKGCLHEGAVLKLDMVHIKYLYNWTGHKTLFLTKHNCALLIIIIALGQTRPTVSSRVLPEARGLDGHLPKPSAPCHLWFGAGKIQRWHLNHTSTAVHPTGLNGAGVSTGAPGVLCCAHPVGLTPRREPRGLAGTSLWGAESPPSFPSRTRPPRRKRPVTGPVLNPDTAAGRRREWPGLARRDAEGGRAERGPAERPAAGAKERQAEPAVRPARAGTGSPFSRPSSARAATGPARRGRRLLWRVAARWPRARRYTDPAPDTPSGARCPACPPLPAPRWPGTLGSMSPTTKNLTSLNISSGTFSSSSSADMVPAAGTAGPPPRAPSPISPVLTVQSRRGPGLPSPPPAKPPNRASKARAAGRTISRRAAGGAEGGGESRPHKAAPPALSATSAAAGQSLLLSQGR